MKLVLVLISQFFFVHLFAQNNSSTPAKNTGGSDSTKAILCSNEHGVQGFMVNKGNGLAEFQNVDVFLSNSSIKAKNVASNTSASNEVQVPAASSSKPKTKQSAVAVQTTKGNSFDSPSQTKLPVLGERH